MAKLRKRTTRLIADGVDLSPFIRGALRHKATWFKPPAVALMRPLTAARVAEMHGVPGSFLWAKRSGQDIAQGLDVMGRAPRPHDVDTEHWADALLKCPTSSLNHRTVRIAGKPYHWRQDYTGQLKLAAGESPW